MLTVTSPASSGAMSLDAMFDREIANLRAAMQWALEHTPPEALRLVAR